MKRFFLSKVLIVLMLLAGLPGMTAAQWQENVIISENQNFEDKETLIETLTIKNTPESPDLIDIGLYKGCKILNLIVETGAKTEIMNLGDDMCSFGAITVEEGAELTFSSLTRNLVKIGSVANNGRFIDLTGAIQKVECPKTFEITKAEGCSEKGALIIHSAVTHDPEVIAVTASLQKFEGNSWKNDEGFVNMPAGEIKCPVTESGIYRVKWVYDNEMGTYTELHSKEFDLLQIKENEELRDVAYDAIAFNNTTEIEGTTISMDNVQVRPCTSEEEAAGFSVGENSNLTLTLKGTNSNLGSLRNYGTMTLKNEGNTRFENETIIYNKGKFTDETGTTTKILGPAGIWIKEFKKGNQWETEIVEGKISSIQCIFWGKSFKRDVTVETLKESEWIDVETINAKDQEEEPQTLRAAEEDNEEWMMKSQYTYSTNLTGTYRFKMQITDGQCVTTWYSQPCELIASNSTISDEQLSIGTSNEPTILSSLQISAGQELEEAKQATLENVQITEHTGSTTPSVDVSENAKVNITLKGCNQLGSIQLGKGSQITLMPEKNGKDMSQQLAISSVRNGGYFTDETATVSLVKDLENHTMIEFTDTIVYQMDNIISVTLKAVGNSSEGEYLLLGDRMIQKFNNETKTWEKVQQETPQLRATKAKGNPDHSAETVINFTTTETGTYRMKVTSENIEDPMHKATLYFMFKIVKLDEEIEIVTIKSQETIDGTSEKYKEANMLIFDAEETEGTVNVILNNVRLVEEKGYEAYTASIIAENQDFTITLNGDNDLAAFVVNEGATATLKKGDNFKSLKTSTVINAGKFTDETGTVQQVFDSNGLSMLSITGYEMPDWNGYILKVNFDFFTGNYEEIEQKGALEHWINGEWVSYYDENTARSTKATAGEGTPESGEKAYTYTGLEEGQYRIKIFAEEWIEGVPEGDEKNSHTATLYHYFTITEPEPEPTYYSIVLPTVEGVTTSPAAGTYWESEGSSFSFSLTLDADYDQSKPEVKANGQVVTPNENGTYTLSNISEDITITIEGVTENTPTGNAEVEENGVKVWGADGKLHLSVPSMKRVWIYGFNGKLVRSLGEISGDVSIDPGKGSYILIVGEKRYKVAL